jgi:hypothetical protein
MPRSPLRTERAALVRHPTSRNSNVPQIITCPQCIAPLRVPDNIASGAQFRCPKCATLFGIPAASPPSELAVSAIVVEPPKPPPAPFVIASDPPASAPPPPAPLPYISDWPEPPVERPPPVAPGLASLENDYALDLGRVFSQAGEHFGELLGPMLGFTAILLTVAAPVLALAPIMGCCIPFLAALLGMYWLILQPMIVAPLEAGYVCVILSKLRGEPWTFGTFFGGFQHCWVPLFLNNLLKNAMLLVCMLPAIATYILFGVNAMLASQEAARLGKKTAEPPDLSLLVLWMIFIALGGLVYRCLHVQYFTFCKYLIVDKRLNALEALQGHATLIRNHYFQVWRGFAVINLIRWSGQIGCCIGYLFSIPYAQALSTCLYWQAVYGPRQPQPAPVD